MSARVEKISFRDVICRCLVPSLGDRDGAVEADAILSALAAAGYAVEDATELATLRAEVARLRGALDRAAVVADEFPARTHGALATTPYAAAEQAADEIAAAIRAMKGADDMTLPERMVEAAALKIQEQADWAGITIAGRVARLLAEQAIRAALARELLEGTNVPGEWAALLDEAQRYVRDKPQWQRWVDGTPLDNDVPVWMADFALMSLRRFACRAAMLGEKGDE